MQEIIYKSAELIFDDSEEKIEVKNIKNSQVDAEIQNNQNNQQ